MKYHIMSIFLLIISISLFADPMGFVAPQYLQSYYDNFSNNYLNAISAGRGHTGVGLTGNVENVLQNPAAFTTDHSQLYIEIFIKPPVSEFNKYQDQQYESLVPIGIFAYGFHAWKHFNFSMNYSTPQSIEYNVLSLELNTGDIIFHYPSYYLYQITATGNYEWKNLRIGLNLLNEIYSFKDQVTWGTAILDRVDHMDYALRFQPGLYYKYKGVSIGTSYMPSTQHTYNFRYQSYDVTLPSQFNAGIGLTYNVTRFATDINLTNCSEMSDQFKNRLDFKAGMETDYHKYTLRCGFMSIPSVWQGAYILPIYNVPGGLVTNLPDSVGMIRSTAQSMLTGGFTWHSELADLTVAFIQDVQNKANYTSVFGSISVNLNKLSIKRIIPGDKEKEIPLEDDTEIEYLE